MLRFIKQNIRDGGYLYIAFPNILSLPTDLIELYFLCRGLHLHTFSAARLERLLAEEGFEVLWVKEEQKNSMSPSSVMLVARSVSNPPSCRKVDIVNFGKSVLYFVIIGLLICARV